MIGSILALESQSTVLCQNKLVSSSSSLPIPRIVTLQLLILPKQSVSSAWKSFAALKPGGQMSKISHGLGQWFLLWRPCCDQLFRHIQ